MKIPTPWQPANWLKIVALIGALFVLAFKTLGSKLSLAGPLVLFILSVGTLTIAPQLPTQMTTTTLWLLIELSAAIGMFYGGHLLFKLLGGHMRASYQPMAFGQMRM